MDAYYVKSVGRTSEKQEGQDRAVLPLSVKSVDTEKRQVTGIASAETIDRDGEIITTAALRKAIAGYMKNPVVLAGHAHKTDSGHSPTVGKVVEYKFIGKALWVSVEFARTELGEEYWILYRDKVQRAFSIGFHPLERPQEQIIDGKRVPVYTEIELFEISCVPVPSNREALTKSKRRKLDFVASKRAGKLPKGWQENDMEEFFQDTKGTLPGLTRAGLWKMYEEGSDYIVEEESRAHEFAKAFLEEAYDCDGYAEEMAAAEEAAAAAEKAAKDPKPDTIWDVWQEKENLLCRQFGNQELYKRYKKYAHAKKKHYSLYEFSAEEVELFMDVEERGVEAAIHKMKTGFYDDDDETEQIKGLVKRK